MSFLRYFISMIAYALVVLPAIQGYPMAKEIVTSGLVVRYAMIAILGAITYLSWYKAVDLVGCAMGTALNSTAALWTIIFSAVLFGSKISCGLQYGEWLSLQVCLFLQLIRKHGRRIYQIRSRSKKRGGILC